MIVKVNRHVYLCLIVFISAFAITNILCYLYMKATSDKSRDYFDSDEDFVEIFPTNPLLTVVETKVEQNRKQSIKQIKRNIEKINNEQQIFNTNRFGPVKAGHFVIVVQVRNNMPFLSLLISSLSKVMGIAGALLIFCHNEYDSTINKIINEIKFARYMQVFYPFNNQVFSRKFPGNDDEFCAGDFNCTKFCTEPGECLRKHDLAQKKHFWWWQMNTVFNGLRITRDHHEPIAFLEENQYVVEDFMYVMKVIIEVGINHPHDIISFGSEAPSQITQYLVPDQQVYQELWDPAHPSIAFAFNQTLWKNIKVNRKLFCRFADYRWDSSLSFLSSQRPEGPFKMLSPVGARVLQLRMCDGTMHDCSVMGTIEDKQIFVTRIRRGMFPQSFTVITSNETVGDVTAGGEWNDVRDAELCMYLGSQ